MRRLLAVSLILLVSALALWATTSGPNIAASVQSSTGWSSPAGIETTKTVAYQVIGSCSTGTIIAGGTHGFAIPAGSTINGIIVSFARKQDALVNGAQIKTDHVKIWKGGAAAGTSKPGNGTGWTPSLATETYGNASDLWGTTWATTDTNASGFGFEIAASEVNCTASKTANVNSFYITVAYTPASTVHGATQTVMVGQ